MNKKTLLNQQMPKSGCFRPTFGIPTRLGPKIEFLQ